MKLLKINGYNNYKLIISCFDDIKRAKGVIVIIPDLKQTAKNYYALARFLNENHYVVYISDIRLHGKSHQENNQDYVSDDYFKDIVNDHLIITKLTEERHPNLPNILLGHGFSSYIVKRYIEINDGIEAAILSGSGYSQSLTLQIMKYISRLLILNKKNRNSLKFIEKYIYINYEKKFANKNWLTSDEKVFNNYLNDETFARPLPLSLYNSFFNNIVVKDKNLSNISPKTKILIISGDQDPVHYKTKHLTHLYNNFEKAGLNTTMQLFNDMRHNIFEEVNKHEVYKYLLDYLNKNV